MSESDFSLPKGCFIRPADLEDKSDLQKLLWEFITTEALSFYIQKFSYVPIVLGLALVASGIAWMLNADAKIVLSLVIFILLIVAYLIWLVFVNPGLNWQNYWVIECHFNLVACGTVENRHTYSNLNYLYVKPAWRERGVDSYLVRHLIEQATPPTYLLCQSKRAEFYANLGFVPVVWQELPPKVAKNFSIFRNSPSVILMQYMTN
ncbi:MAG TPA: hypothetical protein DDZ80_09665 [Cyanobacteria bacterium UBA8803]|nr:hypothetical protein [Cyanobacteria bacterium UBA9273]HBL58762.1 hypothetical protein [Cyanobacteria bacterium UBA8803]